MILMLAFFFVRVHIMCTFQGIIEDRKMSLESVFRIWVTTVILQRMKQFLM